MSERMTTWDSNKLMSNMLEGYKCLCSFYHQSPTPFSGGFILHLVWPHLVNNIATIVS